jgi:hypothetical protein
VIYKERNGHGEEGYMELANEMLPACINGGMNEDMVNDIGWRVGRREGGMDGWMDKLV